MLELGKPDPKETTDVSIQWGVRIPMRDGISLHGVLYTPRGSAEPRPAICTLTPYVAQMWHNFGLYFAARGLPFLVVDVRGRGNSEGTFEPLVNEGRDGHDVVEWLASQGICNGQVGMWGGSYAGLVQWSVAKEFPPHLTTIVPTAAPYLGLDFPFGRNIPQPYLMQWLTLVAGRTSQEKMFWNNERFWGETFRAWFISGEPFEALDAFVGHHSPIFQDWITRLQVDPIWASGNPTDAQYVGMDLPVLTITGAYDGNQPGALTHYRRHQSNAPADARARHFLIIGPGDHAGTRIPQLEFRGLKAGPGSLVDLLQLHKQWYAWAFGQGPRPAFLRDRVAYYVLGCEEWRYASALDAVTQKLETLYLGSRGEANDVFGSGKLTTELRETAELDCYLYDPRELGLADLESLLDPDDVTDQRLVHAMSGRQLIYHSAPFETDVDVCGFFELTLWLSIDQPDTDFRTAIYEIDLNGDSILLGTDVIRARYRLGPRDEHLVETNEPLRYDFTQFPFVARRVKKGHRLRLVVGPLHSIYWQRNHNTGGIVREERLEHARPVSVVLFHDKERPSSLRIPIGAAS